MNIANELYPATHVAIRNIQRAIFIINMNLNKTVTPARKALMSEAARDIQIAADQLGVEWP
jgi:hypothetical protein